MKTLLLLAPVFLAVLCQAQSQTLIRWDFEDGGSQTLYPTHEIVGLSADPVGYNGVFPFNGGFTSGVSGLTHDWSVILRGWPSSFNWDSQDYCQFGYHTESNFLQKIDSLHIWWKKSLSGPAIIHLRSSVNNFSLPLDSVITTYEGDNFWHKWVILVDSLVTSESQVTFRLYGNGAVSSSAGTLAIDSVAIFGKVLASVELDVNVLLSGPWNGTDMSDSLRVKGLIPLTDPYGFGKTVSPSVLGVTGSNAIVDWIEIELRDSLNPSLVVSESAFLLQRDGDVVDVDGVSLPKFYVSGEKHYVSISHRNHLGAMTSQPVLMSGSIDFSSPSTLTWGTEAQKSVGLKNALWSGNVKTSPVNDAIQYTGDGNDRDPMLIVVGNSTPNNVITGYYPTDTNLDGVVKYTGGVNDRDLILQSVGGATPNSVRIEQVP